MRWKPWKPVSCCGVFSWNDSSQHSGGTGFFCPPFPDLWFSKKKQQFGIWANLSKRRGKTYYSFVLHKAQKQKNNKKSSSYLVKVSKVKLSKRELLFCFCWLRPTKTEQQITLLENIILLTLESYFRNGAKEEFCLTGRKPGSIMPISDCWY